MFRGCCRWLPTLRGTLQWVGFAQWVGRADRDRRREAFYRAVTRDAQAPDPRDELQEEPVLAERPGRQESATGDRPMRNLLAGLAALVLLLGGLGCCRSWYSVGTLPADPGR